MLLAFEVCGESPSLALADNGAVVDIRKSRLDRGHADVLPALLDDLLRGDRLERLTSLATTIGPGSYTGVRTCLALVKGLALSRRIPVDGMSAFACLGELSQAGPDDIAIVDAGRGRLWGRNSGDESAAARPIDEVTKHWPEGARAIGSGAVLETARLPANVETIETSLDAASLAKTVMRRRERGLALKRGFDILPLYLRSADAQLSRSKSLVATILERSL